MLRKTPILFAGVAILAVLAGVLYLNANAFWQGIILSVICMLAGIIAMAWDFLFLRMVSHRVLVVGVAYIVATVGAFGLAYGFTTMVGVLEGGESSVLVISIGFAIIVDTLLTAELINHHTREDSPEQNGSHPSTSIPDRRR